MGRPATDLSGKTFNLLTVVRRADATAGDIIPTYKGTFWFCQCSCGNTVVVAGNSLKNGLAKSCGCYRREHCRSIGHKGTAAMVETRRLQREAKQKAKAAEKTVKPKAQKVVRPPKAQKVVRPPKAPKPESIARRIERVAFAMQLKNIYKSLYAWD